ncbi:MAG: hypothetical protein PHQ75_12315, partial [Thermoguttaceae bacterium]|nr:hypothetical protein [Thermoguttaceae bacterium]
CKDQEKTLDVLSRFSNASTYSFDRWITRYQLKAWLDILAYNPAINGTFSAKDYEAMKAALTQTGVIPQKRFPSFSEFIHILPANGTLSTD